MSLFKYPGLYGMDRFENLFESMLDRTSIAELALNPRADILETETGLVVSVDCPGVNPEDISVTLEEGMLVVKGFRNSSEESKGKYVRTERSYGSFKRAFKVGNGYDLSNIEATSSNGVLTVTLAKLAEALPKKVEIKVIPSPQGSEAN